MFTLTDNRKSRIFIMCGDKNYTEVGYEFDLDKHYKTVSSMKDAVKKIFAAVKNEPEKYGITLERASEIVQKVEVRKTAGLVTSKGASVAPLRETNMLISPSDIKGLTIASRNKAMKIMHEKLGRIEKSKRAIDDIGLGELAKVAGILFDKGQIIQGQSTENIAVMSKNIDKDLSPEDALDMVLRMRETEMETK